MATLTPVDNDPFATTATGTGTQPKLTPVDHDPFASATTPMPAAMTYDAPDPNAGFWSTVGSKLHNLAVGGNLFNRVFSDSATFGGLDKAQSLIPGSPSVDELRAQTDQSRKDIGPVASTAADVLGYVAGPGELKMGEGVGNLIGRGIVGRVGGSAVEGGVASGLGTAGHGGSLEDTAKATGAGFGIGALTGALPGGRGAVPDTPPTSALKTDMQTAFKPLENTWINSRNVGQNFDSVSAAMPSGTRVGMGPQLGAKVDEISKEIQNSQVLSADDLAKYQRALMSSARGDADKTIAGDYVDALNTSLGPHAPAVDAANKLANKYKTGRDIDKWLTDPASAPASVAKAVDKRPQFYQSEPGLLDILNGVGDKAKDPSLARQLLNHAASSAATGAIGAGADYLLGGSPVQGGIEGALTGLILPHGVKLARSAPIRNSLLAARHLNATGVPVSPGVYTNPLLQGFGIMSRQAGYGAGSAGGL